MTLKIRNIGILSHVDAGKTTITEQCLFFGGALAQPGDVNQGTTVSDNLDIEKQRGVSVRASGVSFPWKGYQINLIDTPGHTDFSAEVERSLQIMDGAILVVSAVEGLQPHTFALWEALKNRKIPVVVFINKIDRPGADFGKVVDDLESEFGIFTFTRYCPQHEATSDSKIVDVLKNKTVVAGHFDHSIENLANLDEQILEAYLENNAISEETIFSKIKFYTHQRTIIPVYAGIAKKGTGIPELLNGIISNFPDTPKSSGHLAALVYKIEQNQILGRLAYVRLFDGEINVRDNVLNFTTGKKDKVAQIKKSYIGKLIDQQVLKNGDIGIITGFPDVLAGDILGQNHNIPPPTALQVPMMTVQVTPEEDDEYTQLAHALEVLNLEDPKLNLKWYKDEHELHIDLMGKIQLEILDSILRQRFDLKAKFGKPTVIYKETPLNPGNGFAKYTMPKPCWAVITFAIEPGIRGSGLTYKSVVSVDKIKQKYQNEIRDSIPKALQQGIKGWEVSDINITLIGGEDHEIHSRPGDFILATPMALMNGLSKTGTSLLEPVLNFVIKAPEELLGKITGDLHKMRGVFKTPTFSNGNFELTGKVPAATSLDYAIKLGSVSGGKGLIRFSFHGYESCSDDLGATRPYKGVNPLDSSRWILHARGAFKADERKM